VAQIINFAVRLNPEALFSVCP